MIALKFDEAVVSDLLNRAGLFRVLALGFKYPAPGHSDDMRHALSGLAPSASKMPESLAGLYLQVVSKWEGADDDANSSAYNKLFSGESPCSLHETSYGDGKRIAGRPVELADISGFYRAFGLDVSDKNPDMPDHLCAELEFYSLLLVKQSYAMSEGWTDKFEISNRAAARFMDGHLGRWLRALSENMAENNPPEAYTALALLAEKAAGIECDILGVSPVLSDVMSLKDSATEDELTCPKDVSDSAN
ncbi:MAG: molecular chaperone TorD family protein [Nitrospinae bacterium]|nr:molecular chaperone TorD family protein [Nitrospinota bacterium]